MKSDKLFPNLTERADYYDLEGAAKQGFMLPAASSLGLEDALVHNEFDLITRARLLGFYSKRNRLTQPQLRCRLNHIVWLIENIPGSKFAGDTYLSVNKTRHPELYASLKNLWLKQMETQPKQLQIRINAALFSVSEEKSYSVKLVQAILEDSSENLWARRFLSELGSLKQTAYDHQKAPHPFLEIEEYRQYADKVFLDTVFRNGERMPPDAASTLEKVVAKHPDDMNARVELIGHYFCRYKRANALSVDPDSLDRLTRHLLWCIEYIPGSEFLSARPGISYLIEKLPLNERAQLVRVWDRKVKAGQASGRISFRKSESVKVQTTALEEVAIDTGITRIRKPPGPYSYNDWVTEVDLNKAHLEGVYHWVPWKSIANLDSVLDKKHSIDVYSRAKIIGSYDAYYSQAEFTNKTVTEMGLTKSAQASYEKHMIWFIENIPECQFISTFHLSSINKHDPDLYHRLKDALLNQSELHRENLKVQVNVAAAFAQADESTTRKLAERVAALNPNWGAVVLALVGKKLPVSSAPSALKEFDFIEGRKKPKFLKVANQLDLHWQSLFGWSLSTKSVWSNETALSRNPNDLVLRAELLEAYPRHDQYHISFHGLTPDVVVHLVEHNLWFIQNLPDYYMYSEGCRLAHRGFRLDDRYMGPHAILLEAAKRQLKAYPENLKVGLAMNHYFPDGHEREQLEALRKLEKFHPANNKLKSQLDHIVGLNESRLAMRKRAKALKRKRLEAEGKV